MGVVNIVNSFDELTTHTNWYHIPWFNGPLSRMLITFRILSAYMIGWAQDSVAYLRSCLETLVSPDSYHSLGSR